MLIPTAPVVTPDGNTIRVHDVPLLDLHAATICDEAFLSTTTRHTPSVDIAMSVNVPETPVMTCCSAAYEVPAIANTAATHAKTTKDDRTNQLRAAFM